MKQVSVPLMLSFSRTIIQEFKVYRGSKKGAVESQSDILPSELWQSEIGEKEDMYKNISITFINADTLHVFPCQYSYKYRLVNGVYKIYSSKEAKWLPFAYKKGNSLIIKQGLTSVGNIHHPQRSSVMNIAQTRRSAFKSARYTTSATLKDSTEMVAWCNVHYVFQ